MATVKQLNLVAPEIKYKVVATYPHDPKAVTEGLAYFNGELYESTGGDKDQLPLSSMRRVELKTGRILDSRPVKKEYFAEGLTLFQGRIFQLTDLSEIALAYVLKNLRQPPDKLDYKGWKRGWGLTHDDQYLILSDSTDQIHFIDPNSFKIARTIHVNDGTTSVKELNELEYVDGFIYANVYLTDVMVRIDPQDGQINGYLELSRLRPKGCGVSVCVPNGIAHDPMSGHLFVTGKRWPQLFEILLIEKTTAFSQSVNASTTAGSPSTGSNTEAKIPKSKGANKMAKKKTHNTSQPQDGGVGTKQVDPPIIVGGGGSVIIDFKTLPSTVSPPQPGYARRHRIPENITKILISDGITGKIYDITVDPAKFVVNFKIN